MRESLGADVAEADCSRSFDAVGIPALIREPGAIRPAEGCSHPYEGWNNLFL